MCQGKADAGANAQQFIYKDCDALILVLLVHLFMLF